MTDYAERYFEFNHGDQHVHCVGETSLELQPVQF